jgi:hypothetical protein
MDSEAIEDSGADHDENAKVYKMLKKQVFSNIT